MLVDDDHHEQQRGQQKIGGGCCCCSYHHFFNVITFQVSTCSLALRCAAPLLKVLFYAAAALRCRRVCCAGCALHCPPHPVLSSSLRCVGVALLNSCVALPCAVSSFDAVVGSRNHIACFLYIEAKKIHLFLAYHHTSQAISATMFSRVLCSYPLARRATLAVCRWQQPSFSTASAGMVQIKQLRGLTGAPIGECKKALEASLAGSKDDVELMEKAHEWLRINGVQTAEKKAGRNAAEGLIGFQINAAGNIGAIVELNSETDFVSRNVSFQALALELTQKAAKSASAAKPVTSLTGAVSGIPVDQDVVCGVCYLFFQFSVNVVLCVCCWLQSLRCLPWAWTPRSLSWSRPSARTLSSAEQPSYRL